MGGCIVNTTIIKKNINYLSDREDVLMYSEPGMEMAGMAVVYIGSSQFP